MARHENSLGEVSPLALAEAAATCAPILETWKHTLQLEFAVDDARQYYKKDRARAEASRAEAQALGDNILKQFGKPEWPLQYKLLSNTYRDLSQLEEKWGNFDKAISYQEARLALLDGREKFSSAAHSSTAASNYSSSTEWADAYAKKSALLLAKQDRAAAVRNFEQAFLAFDHKDMFVAFSPLKGHAEMMVKDAIRARDYETALGWINDYLDTFKAAAKHYEANSDLKGEILLQKLISYKMYITADLGDKEQFLTALSEYEKTAEGRRPPVCKKDDIFPQVTAPFHKDADIRARLVALGCSESVLVTLDDVPTRGVIFASPKDPELPPHQN